VDDRKREKEVNRERVAVGSRQTAKSKRALCRQTHGRAPFPKLPVWLALSARPSLPARLGRIERRPSTASEAASPEIPHVACPGDWQELLCARCFDAYIAETPGLRPRGTKQKRRGHSRGGGSSCSLHSTPSLFPALTLHIHTRQAYALPPDSINTRFSSDATASKPVRDTLAFCARTLDLSRSPSPIVTPDAGQICLEAARAHPL
jgi:hypothetical protein